MLLISEIFGGVNGVAVRFLTRLAHKAGTCCDEVYLDRRGCVVPFFVYHASAISRAAAIGHAKVIAKHVAEMNYRAGCKRADALDATTPDAPRPIAMCGS